MGDEGSTSPSAAVAASSGAAAALPPLLMSAGLPGAALSTAVPLRCDMTKGDLAQPHTYMAAHIWSHKPYLPITILSPFAADVSV